MSNTYDVIVIGAGCGGLTTALYTARANLKTLIIERAIAGGQMMLTDEIENYSGFQSVKGYELSQLMYDQTISSGAEYKFANVKEVIDQGKYKLVKTDSGEYTTKTVVIATGANPKRLNIPGEDEFRGKGVSYCAVCDGNFFKGKHVVVVGGGDSAIEEANYLTNFADKVTIVHRRDKFRAQPKLVDRVMNNPKIRFLFNVEPVKIYGQQYVEGITLKHRDLSDAEINYLCDGVFVYVGMQPNTKIFKGMHILDENGYIPTSEKMETLKRGIYGVGDVRQKMLRQIITASSDGAIAGVTIRRYIENGEW